MNSYNNQCKKGQGRGECMMPERPMDKECWHNYDESRWPIGMTYVPMQKWRDLYPLDEGFHNGTIFKELNLPFYGRREC